MTFSMPLSSERARSTARTSGEAPPQGIDGRAFSIAVKRLDAIHGVRVVGASGSGFVACAELSAWA